MNNAFKLMHRLRETLLCPNSILGHTDTNIVIRIIGIDENDDEEDDNAAEEQEDVSVSQCRQLTDTGSSSGNMLGTILNNKREPYVHC